MSDHPVHIDSAFTSMTLDLLGNILAKADNPGAVSAYITEAVRELTGARYVILVDSLETSHEAKYRILAINPARKKNWAETFLCHCQYDLGLDSTQATMWGDEMAAERNAFLHETGLGCSLTIPLMVGSVHVGAMLVLGIQDSAHLDSLLSLLKTLSTVLALVVRNGLLFEQQEKIIKERTTALKENEQRLELATKSSNTGLWDWHIAEQQIYFSPIWKEQIGCSNEEIPNVMDEWLKRIHAEDLPRVRKTLDSVISSNETKLEMTFRLRHKNGSYRWILSKAAMCLDEEGNPCRLIGSHIDITEIKKAEAALLESESKYHMLFDTMDQGVVYQDCHGQIIGANSAAQEILGLTLDQLQGRTSRDPRWKSISEDGHELTGENHPSMTALRTGKPALNKIIGVYNPTLDQHRWLQVSAIPQFRSGKNTPDFVYASFSDVTAARNAEFERKQHAELLQRLAAGTASAVGEDFFRALVKHMAGAFNVRYVLVGKVLPGLCKVQTLAVWADGLTGNFEYDLSNTPCENVVGQQVCQYPDGVQERFPEDHLLRQMGVVGYCGVPLFDTNKKPTGILALLDVKPLPPLDERTRAVLAIFSARASAELERLLAEQALIAAENRYRVLFDQSPDGIVIVEPHTGRLLQYNDQICLQLGYTHEELKALTLFDIEAQEHPQDTKAHFQRVIQNGSDSFETKHRTKTGGIRNVHVHAKVINFGSEPIYHCIWRDITSQKEAETKLRLTQFAVDNIADSAFWIDTSGRLTYANDAACMRLEYSREELLQMQVSDLDPNFPIDSWEELWQALKAKKTLFLETVHVSKSGKYIPVEVHANYLAFHGKEFNCAIARDITERKKSEEALKESESRFRTLFQNMSEGVALHELIFDPTEQPVDFRILEVNPAYERHTGLSPESVANQLGSVIYGTGKPPYFDEFKEVAITGKPFHFETYFAPMQKYFEISVVSPKPGRFATVFTDITERKRSEASLQLALEEKIALLKEIHHRVKNNLQIVTSLINLQATRIGNPEIVNALKDTQSRVRSMALLHETLYRFENLSRINFTIYVETLCKHMLRSHGPKTARINIKTQVDKVQLPLDQAVPCGLIINELVTNALKHAFPDERTGEIVVALFPSNADTFTLRVSDNGIGCHAVLLPANESKTLGLQLVNSLNRQLHGKMKVDSNAKGTTFEFLIPIAPAARQDHTNSPPLSPQ